MKCIHSIKLIVLILVALLSTAPGASAKRPHREPTRVLLKLRAGTIPGQRRIQKLGVHAVKIPPQKTMKEFMAELRTRYGTDLEYVEPDTIRYAVLTPDDPSLGSQYYLNTINAPEAWDTTTGTGITIAIADTGVLTTHPDLAAHLVAGFNVVDDNTDVTDINGHGTFVAGVSAAVGNNTIGIAGVAFNASIMPLRISTDAEGTSTDADIAEAIIYAADHGAKVINISFNSEDPAPAGCWTQTVINAASYMNARGGLVVIAAGNAGINKGCSNNAEIINVAATDASDTLTAFSNFGAELDIAAPGEAIFSTNCDACVAPPDGFGGQGDYTTADGTSFAAPVVAGVAALIYAAGPTLTASQAQQILLRTATDLGTAGYDTSFGWGRVNAQNAVGSGQQQSIVNQQEALTNVYAYPNPWDSRIHTNRAVTLANVPDDATINIYTLSGLWVTSITPAIGVAEWPLTNSSGDRVASGLYFYTVASPIAKVKGTIAIIK